MSSRLSEPQSGRLQAGAACTAARSRNDQVATDFRLYVRDTIDETDAARWPRSSQALVARAGARRNRDARLHPSADRAAGDVRASSAYLCRDGRARPRPLCRTRAGRAEQIAARRRGIGRHLVRSIGRRPRSAGFDRPMANSLDAVSDRDFVLETLSAAAIAAVHICRASRRNRGLDLAAGRPGSPE